MKVSKKQYLKAINVVEKYEEQLRKIRITKVKEIKEKQQRREDNCEDHEYINQSYDYGNPNRMKCIHCGKVIND